MVARIIQAIVCGALSIWLIYRIGKRLFNETVGLISSGLAAVYLYFIFYDAALMTEPFFTVSVLAMLELSISIVDKTKEDNNVRRYFHQV